MKYHWTKTLNISSYRSLSMPLEQQGIPQARD
jgi:hypothetical protein